MIATVEEAEKKIIMNLYKKSEMTFAIIAIVIMSACMMIALELNKAVGVDYLFNAIFECVIAAVLFIFILKNKLTEEYGLCRGKVSAKQFLFSIIFLKSGSLLPCIITHASIDMCSAFANQSGLTETRMAVICLVNMVVTVAFAVYFLKLRSPLQPPVDNVPNVNG